MAIERLDMPCALPEEGINGVSSNLPDGAQVSVPGSLFARLFREELAAALFVHDDDEPSERDQ